MCIAAVCPRRAEIIRQLERRQVGEGYTRCHRTASGVLSRQRANWTVTCTFWRAFQGRDTVNLGTEARRAKLRITDGQRTTQKQSWRSRSMSTTNCEELKF